MVGKSPKLGTDPKMLNDLESNLHASPKNQSLGLKVFENVLEGNVLVVLTGGATGIWCPRPVTPIVL